MQSGESSKIIRPVAEEAPDSALALPCDPVDLLANAIESVRAGVEDYKIGTHGRLLSAVRNIHVGIMLLYKELLRRKSPPDSSDVLLKERIVPAVSSSGGLIFIGKGKKTVGGETIKERFNALGVSTDWNRFGKITEVRNDIEHYCTSINQKTLEGLISDACVLIRNFVTTELAEDPLKLFGDEHWSVMLGISKVYEAELADCRKALAAVKWGSNALAEGVLDLSCPSCSGSLLVPSQKSYDDEMTLRCRSCGGEYNSESFVTDAVSTALEEDQYRSIKDGGDELFVSCPCCSHETYVLEEGQCAWCGESVDQTCAMCGCTIPPSELDSSPNCGYCAYKMSKDD